MPPYSTRCYNPLHYTPLQAYVPPSRATSMPTLPLTLAPTLTLTLAPALALTLTPHQAYVALSRATSMLSTRVLSFNPHRVRAHPKVGLTPNPNPNPNPTLTLTRWLPVRDLRHG